MAAIAFTLADVLNDMSAVNNELDTTAGGTDETRSLNAIQTALRYVQTVAATLPRVFSSKGVDPTQTIKTAANTESSPFPIDLLRLDKLWMLDPQTGNPLFPMERIFDVGGHNPTVPWPLNFVTGGTSPAMPRGYYPDGDSLYWQPMPDQVYNVRAYGCWAYRAIEIDRTSPFPFPIQLITPVAMFALKYATLALGDDETGIQKIAVETFTPALRSLRRKDVSSPTPRKYMYTHAT